MMKRGQAALEFLMTYGWAILAAVIAIGVLAYLGVFSPGQYVPTGCTLTAPLGCVEVALSSGAHGINFVIRNGAGENILISDIDLQYSGTTCTLVNATGGTIGGVTPTSLGNGVTQTFNVSGGCTDPAANGFDEGDRFSEEIIVTYTTASGTLAQTSTGRITGTIQA